jgi:hypothetical protein
VSRPTPLLDFFRRGEIGRDVRLQAAEGVLAPSAHEQIGILMLLLDDPDPEIRSTAEMTINRIPEATLTAYLARSDVPLGTREFFADRGVFPADIPALEVDDPLIDALPDEFLETVEGADAAAEAPAEQLGIAQQLAKMTFPERLKAAVKGSREMRAVLVRDPNKLIAASVLSSPKLSEQEVETFARMANVSEDVLRIIGSNRAWTKNYGVILALTKNPKAPLAMSLNNLNRLNDRDLQMLTVDRNVPEALRIAARKKTQEAKRHG